MFDQALLHGELARIDLDEELSRLSNMLIVALVGFAFWLCGLIFAGVLLVAMAWDTAYRLPVVAALVVVYALGAALAWQRFRYWSMRGGKLFAVLREEMAADVALLRSAA